MLIANKNQNLVILIIRLDFLIKILSNGLIKKNKDLIINFSKNNKDYNLIDWLKKNNHLLNQNFSSYKEIYLPRLIYSFFLKDKIIDF